MQVKTRHPFSNCKPHYYPILQPWEQIESSLQAQLIGRLLNPKTNRNGNSSKCPPFLPVKPNIRRDDFNRIWTPSCEVQTTLIDTGSETNRELRTRRHCAFRVKAYVGDIGIIPRHRRVAAGGEIRRRTGGGVGISKIGAQCECEARACFRPIDDQSPKFRCHTIKEHDLIWKVVNQLN